MKQDSGDLLMAFVLVGSHDSRSDCSNTSSNTSSNFYQYLLLVAFVRVESHDSWSDNSNTSSNTSRTTSSNTHQHLLLMPCVSWNRTTACATGLC